MVTRVLLNFGFRFFQSLGAWVGAALCLPLLVVLQCASAESIAPSKSVALFPIDGALSEREDLNQQFTLSVVAMLEQSGLSVMAPSEIALAFEDAGRPPCKGEDPTCLKLLNASLTRDSSLNFALFLSTEMAAGQLSAVSFTLVRRVGAVSRDKVPLFGGESLDEVARLVLSEVAPLVPFELASSDGAEEGSSSSGPSQTTDTTDVPGADLSNIEETTTEYPIVGPAILGAAGITLTSLAIVAATKSSCNRRDPETGFCESGVRVNGGEVLGLGITGGAALSGAVFWFLLGAEEVPIEDAPIEVNVAADDKQAGVSVRGRF